MTSSILSRMNRRASAAWLERFGIISVLMPVDLDVHLQGGDALGRAGDLEIHIAEVVFDALDVGQDLVACRLP